jgi:hypothetical protein
VSGVEGLIAVVITVSGLLVEPRSVIGVDDVSVQITEAEPEHVAAVCGGAHQPLHVADLRWAQSLAERSAVENRFYGSLGHQKGLGSPLVQSPSIGLSPIAARELGIFRRGEA